MDFTALLENVADEHRFLRDFCHFFGYRPDMLSVQRLGSVLDSIAPGSSKAVKDDARQLVQKVLFTTTRVLERMRQEFQGKDEEYAYPLFIITGFSGANRSSHLGARGDAGGSRGPRGPARGAQHLRCHA